MYQKNSFGQLEIKSLQRKLMEILGRTVYGFTLVNGLKISPKCSIVKNKK